jgi:hypothetical protein
MDKYKKIVKEYYLCDYKWNNNIDKFLTKPFRKFIRTDTILKSVNNRIEHIYIDASYGNINIITLTIYFSFEHDLTMFDMTDNTNNCKLINYLEDNKKTLSKFILKISENDKILTIMNSKFDLVTINNLIDSENNTKLYTLTTYELIKNIIAI